jgi:hypothetical protein
MAMRVRETSKAMFGNSFRLELLASIAELDREFYAREIAQRMDVADNLVTGQLAKLHDAGLLSRRASHGAMMYSARKSSIWDAAKKFRDELSSHEPRASEPSETSMSEDRDPALAAAPSAAPDARDASTSGPPAASIPDSDGGLRSFLQLRTVRPALAGFGSVAVAAAPAPQHMQALQRANEVRLARAELKRGVAEGTTTVEAVILSCPWEAASMTIAELLLSQRRWGTTRCSKFLASIGMTETKTVGALTERQRKALAAMV